MTNKEIAEGFCEEEIFRCENCNYPITGDDFNAAVRNGEQIFICPECAENEFTICEYCGEAAPFNETVETDNGFLCGDCCEAYLYWRC